MKTIERPTDRGFVRKLKELFYPHGEFISYGQRLGVEIIRYRHNDGTFSGILFKSAGYLITAKHVVRANNLEGFHCVEGYDLAFRNDPKAKGLKLGYIPPDIITVDNLDVITSTVETPKKLIVIPGKTGYSPSLINIVPFRPADTQAYGLFKPGASGSPVVYNNHIVGLVPAIYKEDGTSGIGAFLFMGKLMKEYMERQGLLMEEAR